MALTSDGWTEVVRPTLLLSRIESSVRRCPPTGVIVRLIAPQDVPSGAIRVGVAFLFIDGTWDMGAADVVAADFSLRREVPSRRDSTERPLGYRVFASPNTPEAVAYRLGLSVQEF